jgi:hypothetical protein
VSSPRYQTFPVSWAYQSKVFSLSSPSTNTRSSTTTALIPRMRFRSLVTRVTLVSLSSSSSPLYTNWVPGTRGKKRLSTVLTKLSGLNSGAKNDSASAAVALKATEASAGDRLAG